MNEFGDKMSDGRTKQQRRVMDLVAQYGIDPNMVIRGTADVDGYETFVLNDDGNRVCEVVGGEVKYLTVPHVWPVGFPVDDLMDALLEWKAVG